MSLERPAQLTAADPGRIKELEHHPVAQPERVGEVGDRQDLLGLCLREDRAGEAVAPPWKLQLRGVVVEDPVLAGEPPEQRSHQRQALHEVVAGSRSSSATTRGPPRLRNSITSTGNPSGSDRSPGIVFAVRSQRRASARDSPLGAESLFDSRDRLPLLTFWPFSAGRPDPNRAPTGGRPPPDRSPSGPDRSLS